VGIYDNRIFLPESWSGNGNHPELDNYQMVQAHFFLFYFTFPFKKNLDELMAKTRNKFAHV